MKVSGPTSFYPTERAVDFLSWRFPWFEPPYASTRGNRYDPLNSSIPPLQVLYVTYPTFSFDIR